MSDIVRERISQGLCPICKGPINTIKSSDYCLVVDDKYGLVAICKDKHTVVSSDKEKVATG